MKILLTLAAVGLAGVTVACSSPAPVIHPMAAAGILTGHLYGVGGPAPGASRPWPGTVTVTGGLGVHRDVQVGADGRFSVLVPAGTYTVAGRSPLYQDGAAACRAAAPVTVASGHRTEADVLCELR